MPDLTIGEGGNGRTVTVHRGDRIIVALPENATAGYRWQAAPLVPGVLAMTGDETQAPPGGGAGAAGVRLLSFRAEEPGRAAIRLELRRAWESGRPPERTFELQVEVSRA